MSIESALKEEPALTDCAEQNLSLRELQGVFVQMRSELVGFLTSRTGNRSTAEDLSHDVFEKLHTVQARIPDAEKARSYILRIAANLAIDRHRVGARRVKILEGAQVLFEDVEPSPEAVLMSRDQIRLVEEALEELPPKVRKVLVLARMHGMPRKQIAAALGISVSSVEKHQRSALLHLRDRLGENF